MIWVRTASSRDLAEIRNILVTTWHATYDTLVGVERVSKITNEWHSILALENNLAAPNSEFLVADDSNTLCGMAYATQKDKTITLNQLYVLPEFHRQRVGLQLLIEIENSFMDCDTISLEVETENQKAQAFYEAYGFKIYGKTNNCGSEDSGIEALLMTKPIFYADD